MQRRKRAERALTSVVATCYLLGVSTRRTERFVESLGVTALSKSQVSEMAKQLDESVEAFRTRPLDAAPYTFVAADRRKRRTADLHWCSRSARTAASGVHTLIATGVNAEGYREILGVQVASAEDGAEWLAFFRDLVARGLPGVALVTSDSHPGLVAAVGAALQSGLAAVPYSIRGQSDVGDPKSSWPWVRTLLHSIFNQPDAESVVAQYDRVPMRWPTNYPRRLSTWMLLAPTCWRSLLSPNRFGARSGRTIPRSASIEKSGAGPTSSASSLTAPRSSASSGPC